MHAPKMEIGWILQDMGSWSSTKNKICGKAIHWLDEECSETDTTEIGSLACYWKDLDFSQHNIA